MTDWTDRYDPELGQWMLRDRTAAEGTGTGVPDYLDIRFTDVGPGFCVAELDVGEHLLNPFGAAHGAVLVPVLSGGRTLADRQQLVAWGDGPVAGRSAAARWPGAPAPARSGRSC